jgi:hypothetical protein
MLSTVVGAAVLGVTSVAYWRLLPRNGRIHPILKTTDISSMVTIGIMTLFTFGTAMLCAGLFG